MLWMFGVLQAEHLRLLERAHAAVRREHEDAHAALAAHRVFGGAAGVARGRAQDVELLRRGAPVRTRTAVPSSCIAMSLKASVGPLDSACRNRPSLQRLQRRDLRRCRRPRRCRSLRPARAGRRPGCRRCTATGSRTPGRRRTGRASAPAWPRRPAGRRCGRYSPPSGARPSSRISQKRARRGVAARAEVLQLSSSLRMRTIGASTVGSACICASASFMRPSTRVVRQDDQVGLRLAFGALALQHRVDRDVVLGQDAGDARQHAGLVGHLQAQVEGGHHLVDRQDRRVAASRRAGTPGAARGGRGRRCAAA